MMIIGLIRNLIFKGYTVVFKINRNQIEVFGLTKYQSNPTDTSEDF